MSRTGAEFAKVARRGHDAAAKVVLPQAIGEDARRERIARRGEPVSEDHSPAAAASAGLCLGNRWICETENLREAGLDPELELRAAARRFADSVRERERSVGSVAE